MKYLFVFLLFFYAASCDNPAEKENAIKNKDIISNDSSNFSVNTYEGSYGTYKDIYLNDSLVSRKWYDSFGVLKMQTPIEIALIGKTSFKFNSGRNYFDQDKTDTIILITNGLPYYNRGVSINGAILNKINDTIYSIRTSKHFDDLKELKIQIEIYQHIENPKEQPITFEILTIPVK